MLPYKRWVGLADPLVAKPLADAVQRGAAGVVLVTTGPTDRPTQSLAIAGALN